MKTALKTAVALLALTITVIADPVPITRVEPPVNPNITLRVDDAPAALVEAIRQQIVSSGALALPEGIEGRPIVRLMLIVMGDQARGTIILGPAPEGN